MFVIFLFNFAMFPAINTIITKIINSSIIVPKLDPVSFGVVGGIGVGLGVGGVGSSGIGSGVAISIAVSALLKSDAFIV